ncbi:MAG: hypothetical protein LQ351_007988 [Letrouitia transgressa]|nr:MAG: hypothetical protein LQ351_007988 [Letrouitia transgressa]
MTDGEPILSFPSPPPSNTLSKEAQQPSPSPPKPEANKSSQHPQESGADQGLKRKRKRPQGPKDLTSQDQGNLISKRTRIASPDGSNKEQEEVRNTNSVNNFSIEHWRETGYWSPKYLDFNSAMSRPLNQKRSSSSLSYTQSVKEGLNPPQYTLGYEQVLQNAGIYMNEEPGQTISDNSQELCEVLLNSFFPPPSNNSFGGQSFLLTLNEMRNENEARVQRDITPLLVPCASLLYLCDRVLQCRHLSAKIQSVWTKVTPLAGPLPIPDYVVGLKQSAFTSDEILRLQIYSAPNKPTIFRDGLYFPFLVCEVKCGENGLNTAQRQSMHVASVAANAIVELFQDPAVFRVKELDREILVFSISHDYEDVRIHGHYAHIEGDKITLHRHLIRILNIRDQNGKEKWTTYHIVRKIYDYFAPIHLERIRGAVAKLPVGSTFGISSSSLESNPETESNSQEMAEGASSYEGTEWAKKPRLKPTAMLQQEIDYLKKREEETNRQFEREKQTMNSQLNALIQQIGKQQDQISRLMETRAG